MKKLIELDATLDALREVIVPAKDIGFGDELTDGYNDGINMAVTVVSGLPTVDAVKVIQCKDCKYKKYYQFPPKYDIKLYCDKHEKVTEEHDYCSWGKRKDGNA